LATLCGSHPLPEKDGPESYGTGENEDAEAEGTLRGGGVESSGTSQNERQGNQDPDQPVHPEKGHKKSGNHLNHRLLRVLRYACVSVAVDNSSPEVDEQRQRSRL